MTDSLSRYYTEEQISNLLVNSFSIEKPSTIIDLGVGGGYLILEAFKRWDYAQYFATDIDALSISKLRRNLPKAEVTNFDGLNPDLHKQFSFLPGTVDIAVCNPPYRNIKKTNLYDKILKKAGFNSLLRSSRLTTDIIFLAQNLNMLKEGGELGIILPDTLLSGVAFKDFRTDLLKTTTILSITQLPDKIFSKTEASTHILMLKKIKSYNPYPVPLKLSNNKGKIKNEYSISSDDLIDRMDYNFYSFNRIRNLKNYTSLKNIGAKIIRGKHSKKELVSKLGSNNFFHTSSFMDYNNSKNIILNNKKPIKKFTQNGDIVIARVGKRSIGQVAYIVSGTLEVSDCIFIIRVAPKYQKIVLKSFTSKIGQDWLKAYAHGVCSKFICKKDLINFPVNKIKRF